MKRPNSDWYYHELTWLNESQDSLRMRNTLNKKVHRFKSDSISRRVLNHWFKEGLLEDQREAGSGWRLFSTSDIIWIELISKMRDFGISLETCKKVKDSLSDNSEKDSNSSFIYLNQAIIHVISDKLQVNLLVFEDGTSDFFTISELEFSIGSAEFLKGFVCIDISRIVKGVFNNILDSKLFDKTALIKHDLKDREVDVLELLRNKTVSQVKVEMKGGEIISLSSEETAETGTQLNDLLRGFSHGSVTLTKHQDKVAKVTKHINHSFNPEHGRNK